MAKKEEEKSYAWLFLLMSLALVGVSMWSVCNEVFIRRPWKQYQKRYFELEKQYLMDKYARFKERFESPDVQEKYMEVKKHLDEAKNAFFSYNTKQYYDGLLSQKKILEEKQLPPLMFELTVIRSKLLEQQYLYSIEHSENTLKKIHELEEKIIQFESRIQDTKHRRGELLKRIAEITSEVDKYTKQLAAFTEDMDKVQRELASVSQESPTLQVHQVYFEEMNEADRCMSCHLGIDSIEAVSTEQPFATHPKRELYLGAHPPERFGCILCHNGQGRATSSPEKAHGEVEYWLTPVLRGSEAQASCSKCHPEESHLQGESVVSKGKRLFKDLGCHGCHTTKGFEKYDRGEMIAPDLLELPKKVYPKWLIEWIRNPRSFRPDSKMPDYKLSDDETVEIAAYLWQNASTVPLPIKDVEEGSKEEGKALLENIGCLACHKDGERGSSYASNLSRIGSKTKYDYMVNWLIDPKILQPKTRMPSLNLTRDEGAHIATYLLTLKGTETETPAELTKELNNSQKAQKGKKLIEMYGCFGCHHISGMETKSKVGAELSSIGSKPIGQFDFGINEKAILKKVGLRHVEENNFKARKAWIVEKIRDSRQFDVGKYLTPGERLRMPYYNLNPDEIDALTVFLISLTDEELPHAFQHAMSEKKHAVEEGYEVVEKYNCTGCHLFTPDKITLLDSTKLVGVIKLKEEDNLFLQLWEENVPLEKKVGETVLIPSAQIKEHIPAQGGDIIPLIMSRLEEEGLLAEEANVFAPPRLYAEGKKVQPEWLFEYLLKPIILRPWIKVRMPVFEMTSQEATKLAKYFSLTDNEDYPYIHIEETRSEYVGGKEKKFPGYLAKAKALFEAKDVNCTSCHISGEKKPEKDPSEWAPDLSFARVRLRPAWITKWLLDPQSIEPGTKMPKFFRPGELQDYFPGTPEEQAIAIKDLLMNFSEVFPSREVAWTGF